MPFQAPSEWLQGQTIPSDPNSRAWQSFLLGSMLLPTPGATFEVRAYPAVTRALDQILQASKTVEPGSQMESKLSDLYWNLQQYKQILETLTGSKTPTAQELKALPAGDKSRVSLWSEVSNLAGTDKRLIKRPDREGMTLTWPSQHITKFLKDVQKLVGG